MLVITDSLTVGQLTFILRVAIQILTLAGPFIIGFIILSNAPRLASFSTHDILNRIVGKLSVTKSSLKWTLNYIRGGRRQSQTANHAQKPDPGRSFGLALTVALLFLYGLLSSLSDIGFLGLYSCFPSGSVQSDKPASIKDEETARSAMMSNFVSGSNPAGVVVNRCEGPSSPFYLNEDISGLGCTSWHNSTWLDREFFSGINTTNSDMLLPMRLGSNVMNVTAFRADPGAQRITVPTISGGILVNPTDTGLQAIFGVPQVNPRQGFTIEKTMALEVDAGCMSLGVYTTRLLDDVTPAFDYISMNGTWRYYSGPDILEGVLANYTDAVREYYLPYFNASTLQSDGTIWSYNKSSHALLSTVPNLQFISLPTIATTGSPEEDAILGKCTNSIREQLGLPAFNLSDEQYYECSLVGLSGSVEDNGTIILAMTQMLCATTSQINMVSATATPSPETAQSTNSTIALNYTRLPSTLNQLTADFWSEVPVSDGSVYFHWQPYQQYTLSDDPTPQSPTFPTSHYIMTKRAWIGSRVAGAASGGYALQRVGSKMLRFSELVGGILLVDAIDHIEGSDQFSPVTVTKWMGQVGSSYILNSIQYNPWVALEAPSIQITNQVGPLSICYHPPFALGFLPLVLSAIIVFVWTIVTLLRTPLRNLRRLKGLYGGMTPYRAAVCPDEDPSALALIWRYDPKSKDHLEVFSPDKAAPMEAEVPMAVDYITLMSAEAKDEKKTGDLGEDMARSREELYELNERTR
jgi:hypothetical protein